MPLFSGTYSNNEDQVYQILEANGFNLAQICGILANIYEESRFNPSAYNSSEGAYGICQWRTPRKDNLFSKYTSSPSLYNQVKFISDELNSSESKAKSALAAVSNTANGAKEAGREFADKYERCASQYDEVRANRALEYWNYYNTNPSILTPAVDLAFTTSQQSTSSQKVSNSVAYYSYLTDHKSYMTDNLSEFTAEGNEYGYLIDMTNGGSFKFYIPEFQDSVDTGWNPVQIPGRSVSIKAYEKTSDRSVTVNLDLYAGVGVYDRGSDSDVVGAMYKDINFVKSLGYPDYGQAITKPPATVKLVLGSAYNLVGVVSNVQVEYLKPLDSQLRSMYTKLTFTVTQNVLDPPSWEDIRNLTTTNVLSEAEEMNAAFAKVNTASEFEALAATYFS